MFSSGKDLILKDSAKTRLPVQELAMQIRFSTQACLRSLFRL